MQVSINKNNKNKEHFFRRRYLLHRVILFDRFQFLLFRRRNHDDSLRLCSGS